MLSFGRVISHKRYFLLKCTECYLQLNGAVSIFLAPDFRIQQLPYMATQGRIYLSVILLITPFSNFCQKTQKGQKKFQLSVKLPIFVLLSIFPRSKQACRVYIFSTLYELYSRFLKKTGQTSGTCQFFIFFSSRMTCSMQCIFMRYI